MGVDFGEARTGIAVSDSMELLANPVAVISEKDFGTAVKKIALKAVELGAETVVVGLPRNMDGSEGDRAKRCRDVADMLRRNLSVPVILWDERGSTKTAAFYLGEAEVWGKKRRQTIDAAAAAVILQSFLDYRRNQPQHGEVSERRT